MSPFKRRDSRDGGFQRGGGRRDFGDRVSHSATCSACGEACEVPFKPTGEKPVYCRECFKKNGGDSRGPRRDSGFGSRGPNIKKELDDINSKLDRILESLNA